MATVLVKPDWHFANAAFGAALCVALFYTQRAAYDHLTSIRRANQITAKAGGEPEMPELFTQNTEDAIGEETLRELAFSPNLDMSEAARRMVIDRVVHAPGGQYWALLLENVSGRHGRERAEEGLAALRYVYHRVSPLPHRQATLRAVVRFLRARLPEVEGRRHAPDTDWKQRSQGERDALHVLQCEADGNTELLLHATGLVERWLARYPFGGAGASAARRTAVVERLRQNQTDDDQLGHILMFVYYDKSATGRKQLRAAGLIGSAIREGDMSSETTVAAAGFETFNGTHVDGVTLHAPPETPGEHEGEDPEARVRRRRRNTVVTEDIPD